MGTDTSSSDLEVLEHRPAGFRRQQAMMGTSRGSVMAEAEHSVETGRAGRPGNGNGHRGVVSYGGTENEMKSVVSYYLVCTFPRSDILVVATIAFLVPTLRHVSRCGSQKEQYQTTRQTWI